MKRICYLFCFVANAPDSDRKDLLSELEVMKKLKPHPHVIKLMGCVTDSGKGNLMRHYYMAYWSTINKILISYLAAQKKAICCELEIYFLL